MKLNKLTYIVVAFFALTFSSCETLPDAEVEHGPLWPLSGEWLTHVYNANGTAVGATTSNPLGTLFAMRTYNTSDNSSTQAWLRLGSTQAYALLGKVNCDISQKTFSGNGITNAAKAAGNTFTLVEAKVLVEASLTHSGNMTDSIYIQYTTTADPGKTYTVRGHRRTGWAEDEY